MRLDKFVLAGCTVMLTCMTPALAQNVLKFNDDAVKVTTIGVAVDTVCLSYDSGVTPVTVMCNQTLTAAALDADGQAADWFRVRSVGADRVVVAQDYSYDNFEHTGVLRLTAEDGTTRDVPVVQAGNDAASTLQGDTKLTVASASDNQHQSGEDACYTKHNKENKKKDQQHGEPVEKKFPLHANAFPLRLCQRDPHLFQYGLHCCCHSFLRWGSASHQVLKQPVTLCSKLLQQFACLLL